MSKKVCLTGIKSTGMPHLGNYIGAIKPALEIAERGKYDCYYFIADYHSLNSVHNPQEYRDYMYEVAASWLALGLDVDRATLYRQSDIPEILELNWILSCFTSKGLMNRAHSYKAKVQDNEEHNRDVDYGVNMGLYTYPVLMASDILFLQADVVPVGPDQLQHLEMTRDIASSFNYIYGDVFKLPEALSQKDGVSVAGLDGKKMSKSYNNHIPLFISEKKLKKLINKIKTDSTPPEEPKNPDDSLIFDLYKLFASEDQVKDLDAWYRRGIGWGEAKAELFNVINAKLEEPRAHYEKLMKDKSKIDKVLKDGAGRVRPRAQKFLKMIKKTIGAL